MDAGGAGVECTEHTVSNRHFGIVAANTACEVLTQKYNSEAAAFYGLRPMPHIYRNESLAAV
jgi:hypothetical protein